jgi:hypothetical protein
MNFFGGKGQTRACAAQDLIIIMNVHFLSSPPGFSDAISLMNDISTKSSDNFTFVVIRFAFNEYGLLLHVSMRFAFLFFTGDGSV